jgi:alpha-amylase
MGTKLHKRLATRGIVFLIVFLFVPTPLFPSGGDIPYNGTDNGTDILLQAFHWESHEGGGGLKWYQILENLVGETREYFTVVWMPPPAESVAPEGYMPMRWDNLNSQYGTQQQLKDVIQALHEAKVEVLADVVINHRSADRQCDGKWADFTRPEMTGKSNFLTNQLPHDCGHGYPDATEGSWSYDGRSYGNDDFDAVGTPDLNHWSDETRHQVIDWLTWLKDVANAGFDGWRYDMIKGYDPAYLGQYNDASHPYLAVGEYWDYNRQPLADVVNRSGNRTMVFDFVLKNKMNDAFHTKDHLYGGALGEVGENGSRGFIGWWSNAAVTFVENHDTGFSRWLHSLPTPCSGDLISVKSAYALILTHPGIPSVYWYDWRDRGDDMKFVIEELIRIRRNNNVKRWSRSWVERAEDGLYAAYIGNEMDEQVAIKIGMQGWNNYEDWQPAQRLGLNHAFDRHFNGCHAFTVYYRNKHW